MTDHVRLHEAEIQDFLDNPASPVGQLLRAIAEEGAALARTLAPVREGNVWSETTTTAMPPGFTKESIRVNSGHFADGTQWTSVNASAAPTIWLQRGLSKMHHSHPFMTEVLWTLH